MLVRLRITMFDQRDVVLLWRGFPAPPAPTRAHAYARTATGSRAPADTAPQWSQDGPKSHPTPRNHYIDPRPPEPKVRGSNPL